MNIKLDQHRNQLITIDLILTAFTTVLAMMTVCGAWFGMNLNSGLEDAPGVFTQVRVWRPRNEDWGNSMKTVCGVCFGVNPQQRKEGAAGCVDQVRVQGI